MDRIARAALVTVATAAVAAVAASGFAGTSFVTTWKSPEARPGTFQGKKVVAVFVSTDEALRRGIETTLANTLTRRGAQGVAAYMLIPTSQLKDEEKAKAMLAQSGAAGVVAMRLVGRDQTMSSSTAGYYSAAPYASMWNGYWGYGWGGVYEPGYLKTETVLHVETLVYSLEQNQLVWAGQSKTTNPKDAHVLVKELVSKVAAEMKKAGLVENNK
jgi:hypothetical protein